MVGTFGCCARAASGQAAAPPTNMMNSRRFIRASFAPPRLKSSHYTAVTYPLEGGAGDADVRFGSEADVECLLYPSKQTFASMSDVGFVRICHAF